MTANHDPVSNHDPVASFAAARWAVSLLGLIALASACGDDPVSDPPGAPDAAPPDAAVNDAAPPEDPANHADIIVESPGANAMMFRDPQLAVNGVRGAGVAQGSLDVFSLGAVTTPPEEADHYITLAWSDRAVTDGPGVDFIVFENAFAYVPGEHHFIEAAVVELSRDGQTWVAMPHDYNNPDELVYSDEPQHWQGFAGVQPVLFHVEDNPVAAADRFDPAQVGGDPFDLADLPAGDAVADDIRQNGFVYLRLVTAATVTNPDTGQPFPNSEFAGGPDIDGVYARHFVTR